MFLVGEESSTLESLQFDLATMEVATKKFSLENRIGEGGFGDVYKVIECNYKNICKCLFCFYLFVLFYLT